LVIATGGETGLKVEGAEKQTLEAEKVTPYAQSKLEEASDIDEARTRDLGS
jgi:hypothetical protein